MAFARTKRQEKSPYMFSQAQSILLEPLFRFKIRRKFASHTPHEFAHRKSFGGNEFGNESAKFATHRRLSVQNDQTNSFVFNCDCGWRYCVSKSWQTNRSLHRTFDAQKTAWELADTEKNGYCDWESFWKISLGTIWFVSFATKFSFWRNGKILVWPLPRRR